MASVELDNKKQEQETNRNAVEYEKRRLAGFRERVKQKQLEIKRENKNLESLKESEETKKQLVETENKNLKIFEQEVLFFIKFLIYIKKIFLNIIYFKLKKNASF